LLNKKPEEIIRWFTGKGYKISWNWRDTWKEQHARAFTVAKAMNMDVLSSIRGEVENALEEGTTLREFQKNLEPTLKKLGWWGRQEKVNPKTGEIEEVQLGSPWRLKTIYRTNMQTSYMTGRYRHQMQAAKMRPWWMYDAVNDSHTRPSHAAHDGQVRRYDDPFWDKYYPPNGWGCRCTVRTLSGDQLQSRGITPAKGLPAQPIADEGWDYNPGKTAYWDPNYDRPDCGMSGSFADDCLPPADNLSWKDYGRPDARDIPNSKKLTAKKLPRGETTAEALGIMANALNVSEKDPYRWVKSPVSEEVIDYHKLPHIVQKRTHARERYANYVLKTLQDPYEIYNKQYEDGPRRRYIGLFTGKNNLLVVVRINKDGSLLWNVMQADDKRINKQRKGELIYGK
jgi:SPP1 gp7 family putative phage head morphogenesis protein